MTPPNSGPNRLIYAMEDSMTDDTTLTKRPESRMDKIRSFVLGEEALERFTGMMGKNAIYYLNQVMIVVANSDKLQECRPASILVSAMRAASLRLSVDPAKGQAWIIPYKGEATLQIGYRGVYELAMRTNQYRFINVIKIYEGEEIIENRMTGNHTIGGKRTGNTVTAFMLYFQLYNGFEKTFVMTVPEIEAHAAHYSQGYTNPKSKWNDPVERPKMMAKTVLTNGLRKWGRFNEDDANTLEEIEADQGWQDRLHEPIEGEFTKVDEPPQTEAAIMGDLGFDTSNAKAEEIKPKMTIEEAMNETNKNGKKFGEIASDRLQEMATALENALHEMTGEAKEKAERKLKAIGVILTARQGESE
jgi:recombination protein RecT